MKSKGINEVGPNLEGDLLTNNNLNTVLQI